VATVIGATAARVDAVEDNSIVGASIVGNDLVFSKGDGVTTINAGRVIPPLYFSWPVGTIFMNTSATNPASLLGGGTWVRWGKGRMPISLDEANARWDVAEDTGGADTVTLAIAQIPSHAHGGGTTGQSADHSHGGYTDSQGSHQHGYQYPNDAAGAAAGSMNYWRPYRTAGATDWGGAHTHNIATYGASNDHSHGVYAEGGGGAHENMPPFIAVYMWKRTA